VQQSLQSALPEQTIEVLRAEIVGPQVSADLRQKALLAIFYSVLGIVIYLSGRFEAKWLIAIALAGAIFAVTYPITLWFPGVSPLILIIVALVVTTVFGIVLQLYYALAALMAIYHDVLITVGFLSLFNKEFDLQIVAALLTIIGYSLNDTIVIFDRIRENMRGRRREEFSAVVNRSLNETLSRTILTSGLTLLVVLALFFLGGEVIHGFAFALLVGIIAGVYSTLVIATPLLAYWHQRMPFQSARKATATSAPPTSASSP
jgi:preprotein translocase subunit SecF